MCPRAKLRFVVARRLVGTALEIFAMFGGALFGGQLAVRAVAVIPSNGRMPTRCSGQFAGKSQPVAVGVGEQKLQRSPGR